MVEEKHAKINRGKKNKQRLFLNREKEEFMKMKDGGREQTQKPGMDSSCPQSNTW